MKDGVGLGFAGPRQLGCRKVRLLRARVAHARGGEEGHQGKQDLLLKACRYQGDALPGGAGIVEAAARKRRCPGCPAPQAQPCQEPEPAAGLQKKPHPCGMLPSREPSQPARGQACQAARCWK